MSVSVAPVRLAQRAADDGIGVGQCEQVSAADNRISLRRQPLAPPAIALARHLLERDDVGAAPEQLLQLERSASLTRPFTFHDKSLMVRWSREYGGI